MTDNIAILDGFTDEYVAYAGDIELYLLVKPETNFDDAFKAWDIDMQEFIRVNGWLFRFEKAGE